MTGFFFVLLIVSVGHLVVNNKVNFFINKLKSFCELTY